jgi:hypothetical protein
VAVKYLDHLYDLRPPPDGQIRSRRNGVRERAVTSSHGRQALQKPTYQSAAILFSGPDVTYVGIKGVPANSADHANIISLAAA